MLEPGHQSLGEADVRACGAAGLFAGIRPGNPRVMTDAQQNSVTDPDDPAAPHPPSDTATTPPPPATDGGGDHDTEVRRAGYDADAVGGDAVAYRPE